MKKDFEEVWLDIQKALRHRSKISTLCRKIDNLIVEVTPDYITLRSKLSRKGTLRKLSREDFRYVWDKLVEEGIYGLDGIRGIIGRRAIICAIMGLLSYVDAGCINGKIHLRLKG